MSLATRCVSCGTVFRVVQDQLKVSEGWVRCGRCEHVFNALDSLFDLESETPPPWPPKEAAEAPAVVVDTPAPASSAELSSSAGLLGAASAPAVAVGGAADRPRRLFSWSQPAPLEPAAASDSTAAATEVPTEILAAPTEISSEITTEILAEGMPPLHISASELDSQADDLRALPADAPTPEFVRRAQAAERWNRPRTRVGLALLGILLGVVLVLQVTLHQRDWIAARWPVAAPALRDLCGLVNCELDALRRIDSLTVESSGLTAMSGGNVHRLNVTLRNRDGLVLKLPAVELTLTDTRGQVVARKVLLAADFGLSQATIGAGLELPLEVLLDTGDHRIAGYSIEIFYP